MMGTPLRVLIIEDSEDDCLLLLRQMRRGGYEPRHERVDTPEGMTAALKRQDWDIILSDHAMPRFSALQALSLLQGSQLDLPFIIVSGTIGENTAVAAMKAGAHDYLIKGNLARINAAIERELRDAEVRRERKRGEEQIQRHRNRQAALYDVNLAVTSTLDLRFVLDLLLTKIDSLLPYRVGSVVRLRNDATGSLEVLATRNLDASVLTERRWQDGEALTKEVLEGKTPLAVGDVQALESLADLDFFRTNGLVSYLGVPLIARGEALGVLSFYTSEQRTFHEEEVEFLNTLAGQASIAIDNARLYGELRRQAEELKRSNRVKSEFLSIMSHELRTPLTVVLGYSELIQNRTFGEINRDQEKALTKILTRGRDLLNLINEILEVTRIEADMVGVKGQPTDLMNFIEEIRASYDQPLDKGVSLCWEYRPDLPWVNVDRTKLGHVMRNLVDNAVKFTEKGTVTVSVRLEPRDEEGGNVSPPSASMGGGSHRLELRVRDTGVGIAPEDIPSIFEMFKQADSSDTREYGGLGIGLFIVKKFTEIMGGKVKVESEPGKGTTFTVAIPTAPK